MNRDIICANVHEIRQLCEKHNKGKQIDSLRLIEIVEGIDNWLSRGGELPIAWMNAQKPELSEEEFFEPILI